MFVSLDLEMGGPRCSILQLLAELLDIDIMTEFRQPLQVKIHLEMPRILVQLGHIQHTKKRAPQTDPKWSPTWSVTRYQAICPLSTRDGRYACQVSRAQRTHSRP